MARDGSATYRELRLPFREIKKAFPEGYAFRCAEVGVFKGINAKKFLDEMNIEHAWLVDCWGHFENEPQTIANHKIDENPTFWDKTYEQVQEVFKNYPNVSLVKAWSQEAAGLVPDDLDFVYIDADHTYDATVQDIKLWLPKLKIGGWLMGDDYMWEGTHKAVNDFVEKYNYILHSGSKNTQWWFIKDHNPEDEYYV